MPTSSMLLLRVPGSLQRAGISVNLEAHLLSENENPRSVTGMWNSSPSLLSEYTFLHTVCAPGLRS